jgi:hypothetical protein
MRRLNSIVVSSLLLASCQSLPDRADLGVVETHEAMVSWINPPALLIWDVADKAKSETEGLDPAEMNEAAWQRLQGAAQALEIGSRRMAEARILRVGAHTAEEDGFASKAEIQELIDQDPIWFRELSGKMAVQASDLHAAAVARDLRKTRDMAEGLSEACQACHTRYWEKPTG